MREIDLGPFRQLLAACQSLDEAMARAREDLESIGLAEGDPFIAFECIEDAVADIGDLLEDAHTIVELDGVDVDFDSFADLLRAYEDELEAFRGQLEDAFQYLAFDIEDILVDMPPLNRERLDDEDAILYSALELGEMTEPWRNVMRLAEGFIHLRLQQLGKRLRELLAALDEGD